MEDNSMIQVDKVKKKSNSTRIWLTVKKMEHNKKIG